MGFFDHQLLATHTNLFGCYANYDPQFTMHRLKIVPLTIMVVFPVKSGTSMGVFIDALNNSDSEYIGAVEQIKDIISRRTRMPFHHPDIIFNNTSSGRACNKLIAKTHEFTHKVRL